MTREEIIQAISDDKMMPFIQPEQLAQIVSFVINNYQPSLPSNLDKAANIQAALEQPYKWEVEQDGSFGVTPLFVMSNIRSAFKAGAEWQANQLLKGSPLPEDTVLFQKGVEEGRRLEKDDHRLTWEDTRKIVQIADKMLDDPKMRVEFRNHNEEYFYKRVLGEYNILHKTKEGRK